MHRTWVRWKLYAIFERVISNERGKLRSKVNQTRGWNFRVAMLGNDADERLWNDNKYVCVRGEHREILRRDGYSI